MNSAITLTDRPAPKVRRAYHTPHLMDFGPVNELTRGGIVHDDELGTGFAPDGLIPGY